MFMRRLLIVASFLVLSGCNSISSFVPSFWDDNQSRSIITARQLVVNIDCGQPQAPQAVAIKAELQWFDLYSESKGQAQADVRELIAPWYQTVSEWADRATKEEPSSGYCKLKKGILTTQAEKASKAVLGRFAL